MISLQKARSIIWKETQVLPSERVGLIRSLGRTLAENIEAKFDMPPFNRAAMDGYAVNSDDTYTASSNSPVVLNVCGEIPAGAQKVKRIKKGNAVSIMTGAVLPPGCDSVVRLEETEELVENKERKIRIFEKITPGNDVSYKGEDLRRGEIILKKGQVVNSTALAMLAYLGRKEVSVCRKPEVAIVPTGDEIKKVGEKLSTGEIYDSNSYGMFAQVLKYGGNPHVLGIASDNLNVLSRLVRRGLEQDMLLISGGVSAGKYDLVVDVFKRIGVKVLFWKVAARPGMPLLFGKKGKTLVFGLPGYPVSSHLSFENFVRFAFSRMLGQPKPERLKIEAFVETPLTNLSKLDNFMRVKLKFKKGHYYAIPYHTQKSGVLRSLVESDGIVHLKKGETAKEKVMVEIL